MKQFVLEIRNFIYQEYRVLQNIVSTKKFNYILNVLHALAGTNFQLFFII